MTPIETKAPQTTNAVEGEALETLSSSLVGPQMPKQAVALRYEQPQAPVVVAKGEGILAEKIIEAAREHGIYVQENPVLAQALGAVELDEEIPVELYRAVAEVIGFVLSLQKEAAP